MENLNLNNKTSENEICQHCGKPKIKLELQFYWGKTMEMWKPTCDCEEKARLKNEEEKEKKLMQEKIKKIFDNSLMTPFFREKTFDKLNAHKSLDFCKKYAREFEPGKSKGLQFIGEVGTGKTTLLAAISNDLMNRGYTCLFTTLSALLDKFIGYSCENRGDVSGLLKWLVKFDFVVLDDIGRETYTQRRAELAFIIMDALLNAKVTTCISANPNMIDRMESINEMEATLDRIRELCPKCLEFRGESLRGKP